MNEKDERKLIFTRTGFGVKEISKEIGIKRNLDKLIYLVLEANSKSKCKFCEKPCENPWCPYTKKRTV